MKFSVIIPAYNSAGWIEKGLRSIREQSFTDYELIVVCDSCRDNTAEIARSFGAKVIEVEYGLDGLTRNAGIDAAQGDWLLFMDDDDWFLHEFAFEMLAEITYSNNVDVIFFDFIWKGRCYTRNRGNFVAVWSKTWKRKFVGDTRFPAMPYWSDVEFHQRMMRKEPRTYFANTPLYYYNFLREGSISWQKERGLIK